jgi:hypothetical protein
VVEPAATAIQHHIVVATSWNGAKTTYGGEIAASALKTTTSSGRIVGNSNKTTSSDRTAGNSDEHKQQTKNRGTNSIS